MVLPPSAKAALATTPVPYMGWNTYYQVGSETPGSNNVNESTIKSVANSLISTGLARAGYKIVWLDFGWATGARDSGGNLIVDPSQWPDGMSGLTSYLHGLGLQAGIYTDAGNSGCSGQGVGSYGHYQQDADQFAAWGFDAVKVDFCGAGQQWSDVYPNDPRTLYAQFSNALANNSSGRPMILNVCNFWTPGQIDGTAPAFADSSWDSYSWAPSEAQSWRTDTDIGSPRKPDSTGGIKFVNVLRNLGHDTGTASNASQPGIQTAAGPPGTPTSSPIVWGHWNDPDYLGPGLGMTDTQAQSQFSMWAMVAAPLILGSDPRLLSSTNLSMLKNANVIAIDQDSSGVQGYLLTQNGTGQQVWVKPLADGSRAVALFNTASNAARITTTAKAVGMPNTGQYRLLNVWTNQTSTTTNKITANVPANAVVLYRVALSQPLPSAGGSQPPASAEAPQPPSSAGPPSPGGAPPSVVAGVLSAKSSASALFSGSVNPERLATTAYFRYGLDPSYAGGGPVVYTNQVAASPSPVGSDSSSHLVSATTTGLIPNAKYHVQLVATNSAGTTFGPDQTLMTKADPAPSGPTLGKSFKILPLSGHVYIELPGSNSSSLLSSTGPGYVPLTELRSIPAGSQIDSRYGTFKLTSASGKEGQVSSGTFGGAIVTVSQAKNGRDKGLTTFRLLLGAFPGAPNLKGCGTNKMSRGPVSDGRLARIGSIPSTYHSHSHGRYRTVYGRASGSSSGASWDTSVGCDGVMFKVFRGTILVNDSARHKTVLLQARQHYLAQGR